MERAWDIMKKELKGFVSGFLAASLCAGMVAFAANYEAVTAGFKVFVNGEEFHSDPPALVVEGRTYLPLRAMGDALGVPVNWNDALGQAEVGTPPAKDSIVYYERTPWCPDFGYYAGQELRRTIELSDGGLAYVYGIGPIKENALVDYGTLLMELGFEYIPVDDGLFFVKGNYRFSLHIDSDRIETVVMVWESTD